MSVSRKVACRCAGLLYLLALTTPPPATAQSKPTAQRAAGRSTGETIESHLGRGYDALKQDSYAVAAAEFRAALRLDPKLTLRARFPLAVALFELHLPAESRKELEAVRREAGDHPNILYYLGRLDLEDRKFPAAIANLSQAAQKPPFPDTAYYLGFAYFQNDNFVEAEQWLNNATQMTPQDARVLYQLAQVYRKEGHEEQARDALRRSEDVRQRANAVSQLRVDCAQKLNQQKLNRQNLEQGPSEEAHSLCDQLYDPADAAKLTALGTIYGQHGDLESALKPLQKAAELEPESPQSQYNLAFTYYQLNRFEDARTPLAKAVERWPDLFQLNALYGAVLAKLGEDEAAYAALRHAHRLSPADKSTEDLLFLTTLGLGRKKLAAKEVEQALRYFQEAARLKPQEASPHEEISEIYESLGKPVSAAAERSKALHLRKRPASTN